MVASVWDTRRVWCMSLPIAIGSTFLPEIVEAHPLICKLQRREAPTILFNPATRTYQTVGARRPGGHGLVGSNRGQVVAVAVGTDGRHLWHHWVGRIRERHGGPGHVVEIGILLGAAWLPIFLQM